MMNAKMEDTYLILDSLLKVASITARWYHKRCSISCIDQSLTRQDQSAKINNPGFPGLVEEVMQGIDI